MRAVGEGNMGRLAQAKRCPKALKERNVEVACTGCGHIAYFNEVSSRNAAYHKAMTIHDSWKCHKCKAADQREVNQALVNIARRKGLIK